MPIITRILSINHALKRSTCIMATDPVANYKARKEAFVSNLSGSSLNEINQVTLVAAVRLRRLLMYFLDFG